MTPLRLNARIAILLAACASTALAQLEISVIDPDLPPGANETILGTLPELPTTYDLGDHAVGTSKTYQVKLRNTTDAGVAVTQFSAGGGGFVLNNFSLPRTIPPGGFDRAELIFTPQIAAHYSANLQINGSSVILLGTGVAGPELSVIEGGGGGDAGCTTPEDRTFDFGEIIAGDSALCHFSLHLPAESSSPIVVNRLNLHSTGFAGPSNLSATVPATLTSSNPLTFDVRFEPTGPGVYAGSLLINGVAYSLEGTALQQPIPKPIFEWGGNALASGQQRRLTIRLPDPSPITATGQLKMSFEPASAGIEDDPTVRLMTGTPRSIPFHVVGGSTVVSLGSAREVIFQTGASAGKIHFLLDGIPSGFEGGDASLELTIPPQSIVIDLSETSRRAAGLDVHLIGFDNTYTAGTMQFTFQDQSGNVVGNGPMQFNFGAKFSEYYAQGTAGGAFDLLLRFPVSGDIGQVRSVAVELTNSAGSTQTGTLDFP